MKKISLALAFSAGALLANPPAGGAPALNIGASIDMVAEMPLDEPREGGFELRAVELNLGAPIDPFFDGVVTISYGDGEMGVEEAWVSTILPGNIKAVLGREMLSFGYLNHIHEDDYPQADAPFVLEELLSDDGLVGDGGHLEIFLPLINPTLSVYFGGYQEIGASSGRRMGGTPLFTRVQSYIQSFNGNHQLLYGFSQLWTSGSRYFADGHEDDRRALGLINNMTALDFKYKFSAGGQTYRGLTLGGELVRVSYTPNRDHDDFDIVPEKGFEGDLGWYIYGMWNFNRFWGVGYRFDHTDLLLDGLGDRGAMRTEVETDKMHGHTVYGEWRASEFSRIRLQYQSVKEPGDDREHTLMLQGTFFFGWHPPHRY